MNFEFLQKVYFGNSLLDYGIALVVLIFSVLFVKVVLSLVIKKCRKMADKTESKIDDLVVSILEKIVLPAMYLISLYLATFWLVLPAALTKLTQGLQQAIVAFFIARIIIVILDFSIKIYFHKHKEDQNQYRSFEGMFKAVKFVIWALALIIFLDNIGFKISTLLAGLGIGGIAVAIAGQALLKDFFSYFSLMFDKPFKIGDFIQVGEFVGTVEYIGIKTTRIRSIVGEMVVFGNADLTESRVRNYQELEKRRSEFHLMLSYTTKVEQLKNVPELIKNIIESTECAEFERAHFKNFCDYGLNYEIVYFVLSPDYTNFMNVQEKINLSIKETFEAKKIHFAYPTHTVYLKGAIKN